jgi:hypothetical protein
MDDSKGSCLTQPLLRCRYDPENRLPGQLSEKLTPMLKDYVKSATGGLKGVSQEWHEDKAVWDVFFAPQGL